MFLIIWQENMEQFTVSFGLMILPDRISIRGYV